MIKTNNFTLEYVYSGLFTTDSTWIHPQKTEITYELIYVTSGEVFLEENGRRYHLRQNDAIFLEAGKVHKGYMKSTPPVSFYWIHFHIDDFSKTKIENKHIKNFTNSFIFKNLLHIANNSLYPSGSAEAMLVTILNEFAYFTNHTASSDYKSVRDAAEWIRINSLKKIYLDDIASRYNMNYQYFSKLFKKYHSIGLKNYICSERMNTARNLLCNTNKSIKEISVLMNFNSENEFVNFFKYHQHQSPKKFRNSFSHIHMNNK